jgi:hypothetical protein
MVYLTEAARQHLRALRAAMQRTRADRIPRIAARTRGQLGVFRGVRTSQDTVIYHEDMPLLLLAPGIAAKLDRTVIHCRNRQGGPQLVVTLLPATPDDRLRGSSSRNQYEM